MWQEIDHAYLDQKDLEDCVQRYLGCLDDSQRTIIYLRYWKGLNKSECARYLKVSVESVRQKEFRTLRILRKTNHKTFLEDFCRYRSQKVVSEETPPPTSVFDIHPAFRQAFLCCKKYPLIKKEEMERKAREEEIAKRSEYEKLLFEKRKREEKLAEECRIAQASRIKELIKQREQEQEEYLWKASEMRTPFDDWYERTMGCQLKK